MLKSWRSIILGLSLILILGLTNWSIFQKEQLLAQGQVVLLKLAPVDPRSLIQGDYMALRYELAREVNSVDGSQRGLLVIKLDANQVGTFQRFHNPAQLLAANERLLEYHQRASSSDIYVGAESFFFQEGQAPHFEDADYGELRVTATGESLLVGLRDENFQPLGPANDE